MKYRQPFRILRKVYEENAFFEAIIGISTKWADLKYIFFRYKDCFTPCLSDVLVGLNSCFALSPRRPYEEYKRMVFEHTHGLFIT
jgi:hypothetical protein